MAIAAGPPNKGDVLDVVLGVLEGALDETSQEMADLIEAEVSEYRTFSSEGDAREWREGLREALGLFVSLQRRPSTTFSPAELRKIEGIGMRRADQHIELPAVLASIRLAMCAALGVVGAIAEKVAGDESRAARDVMALRMTCFVNDFSDAVSRGFLLRRVEQAAERERDRVQLYIDLLTGAYTTYDAVKRAAQGVDVPVPARAALVLVPSHCKGSAAMLAEIRDGSPGVVVVPVTSAAVPHVVLVVPEGEWRHAERRISEAAELHRVVALFVGVLDMPIEVHERYLEASSMMAVAPDKSDDDEWLVPVRDLAHLYLVANAGEAVIAIVRRNVLEPLREHPRLMDALDAYFRSSGSPKGAAIRLGVTETTARSYRTKIETVTGLLFDRPADVIWLGYAWALERLRKSTPP